MHHSSTSGPSGRVESGVGLGLSLRIPLSLHIIFSFIYWTVFQWAKPGAQDGHRALILPEGTLGLAPPLP